MASDPTYTASVAAAVDEALRQAGISQTHLSHKTTIPVSTLNRALRGMAPFNVSQLDAIARCLGVPVETFTAPRQAA